MFEISGVVQIAHCPIVKSDGIPVFYKGGD